MIKVFAPYQQFKFKYLWFSRGWRMCNQRDIKLLRTVPYSMGEIKTQDGEVLNPAPKKPKKTVKKAAKKEIKNVINSKYTS